MSAVRTPELVAALLDLTESGAGSPAGEPALRVDATEFRLGDTGLLDDEFLPLSGMEQVVQLEWSAARAAGARWIRMTLGTHSMT